MSDSTNSIIIHYGNPTATRAYIDISLKDEDPLFSYQKFQGTFAPDRFGYMNKFSRWRFPDKPICTIPRFSSEMTFVECMQKRVDYYISTGDDIYVSCSGGVDSVAVVSAFILYGLDIKKLHVLYTATSVAEYPLFFDILKRDGIDLIKCDYTNIHLLYKAITEIGLVIFGTCGDQLFGSSINLEYPQWFHKDYHDFCREFGYTDSAIQQQEEAFAYYGVPIKHTSEYLWWMNFSIKHTKVKYNESLQIHPKRYFEAFYDSPLFDDWSCSHFDDKDIALPTEPLYYRPQQKAIIFQYTGDDVYLNTKIKVGSWCNSTCKEEMATCTYMDTEGIKTVGAREYKKVLETYRR